MTMRCRIKKALGILSPSMYEYCKLHLNCNNIKRCEKCKHFETSKYYAKEVGEALVKGLERGHKK